MYYQYGSYQHFDGEVNLTVTKRPNVNARGFISHTTVQHVLEGVLIGSGSTTAGLQASIEAQVRLLELAYALDGKDAGLFHDDGTATPHFLQSSAAIGGVRVLGLSYTKDAGDGQYATGRSYSITLEADFPASVNFQMWQETISVAGTGGPRTVLIETISGPPLRQIVNQKTIVRATQSGRAVGFRKYPAYPPPVWPNLEKVDQRRQQKDAPRNHHGTFIDWPITWSYSFESPVPLFGTPHRK